MATLKLTDTQCVILAAAGGRESGLVLPLPKSLRINPGTQTIVLRGLLKKQLIEARAAQPGHQVWETAEDGTRTTLIITNAGLEAIGIAPESSGTAETTSATPRTKHPAAGVSGGPKSKAKRTAAAEKVTDAPSAEPAKETKLGMLIAALRRKKGATIADLMEATGWQAHSVRGAISGALKKKLKLEVVSEAVEGRDRVYRIGGQSA